MKQNYEAAFTITSLENQTDKELSLSITAIGSSSSQSLFLTIPAYQKVSSLELSFGPQEKYEHQPVKGYLITNTQSTEPIKTVRAQFEYKENPLSDIPYFYDHRSLRLPYLYYWTLYCDDKQIQLLHIEEHERKKYSLIIKNLCSVQVIESTAG